jgi:hypothetical protein
MDKLHRSIFTFLFAVFVGLPAAGVPIAFLGTFDDPSASESAGDIFVLTNTTPTRSRTSCRW